MADQASNDVFISYRRNVSGMWVRALWKDLRDRGIDGFYDIESIRAGQYERIIFGQIEARPYFIPILTPGSLERCIDPGDLLRREIEHAVTNERVIVPVHTTDFDFADCERFLRGGLGKKILSYNAQELSQRFYDASIDQLVKKLPPIQLTTTATPARDQKVVEEIRNEAEAAPTVITKQLSAQKQVELGVIQYNKGDFDGAASQFEAAMRLDPEYAPAYYYRGLARSGKGDLGRAIADYSEAIDLNPQYADAFLGRGNARGKKGDLEGALLDLDEAIRFNPGYAEAFNKRGIARWGTGDLDGAIADYDEAIRLEPEYANAYVNRALARRANGDLDGADADKVEASRLDRTRH
jgi:tetratricopeptide (TPR) repeat protein